jgi:hypothetical protein
MVVSGEKVDDLKVRGRRVLDGRGRPTFTAALNRTPHGGSAVIVCTEKPPERVALEVCPRLIVVFREGVQINET